LGAVYQAGTLSGNPIAMAAGKAQLSLLWDNPQWYAQLNKTAGEFFTALRATAEEFGCQVNYIGSLGNPFFTSTPVMDYATAKTADTAKYASYFRFMLERNIYLAPAQFEAMFLCASHTQSDLERTLAVAKDFFQTI